MYEARADSINVNDIAKSSNNRIVLRRIKRHNVNYVESYYKSLYVQNEHDEDGEDCIDYVPEGTDDMGWLGYFVGKNEHVEELVIHPFTPPSGFSVRDVMESFYRGVNQNKSIREIKFLGADLLAGEMFTMLGPFFNNNHNLTSISVRNCVWGDEGGRLFALALGSCCTNKSLRKVDLESSNVAEEGMVDIVTALSMHPHLKHLDLNRNHLRKNGCVALATLLRCSATELEHLYLSRNDIGDEGIEALVPALTNCNHLKELYLIGNPSITTKGWQSLATMLEAPNSNLQELYISQNNIDDEAAATFANALANNQTLHTLHLDHNPSITAVGWQALSKILCNTSSVNATFLSNHTLQYVSVDASENGMIGPLLELNERNDKKEVAMIKILQCHSDFEMLPFFEWEFKVLPLVLSWLERASAFGMPRGFEPNIEPRKLSTIYQFVRGMPVLYVETRLKKELEDIKAREKQMEEEQLKLHEESEERKQYLQEHKELLEERKKSIMKRIGKPNFAT